MTTTKVSYEQTVIDQLKEYNPMLGRIKVLERYPIGAGMFVDFSNEDDVLQDLHRQLKGLPSYMYLNKKEQELESVAHAYLSEYPLGTKRQLREVKQARGVSDEDRARLKELVRKIEKVIEARSGNLDGIEGVLQRVSEVQELQHKIEMIDFVLNVMESYQPLYVTLLRERFIEDKPVDDVCAILSISRKTFDRWRPKAIEEFAKLSGMSHE